MKKFTLTIICMFIVMCSFAQSTDEKVGAMVNNGQWFELREFYKTSHGGIYRLLCHTFNGTSSMMNPDTGDASYGILYSTMLPVVQKNGSLKLT